MLTPHIIEEEKLLQIDSESNLVLSDATILKELETLVNQSLPRVKYSSERGYVEEKNHIIRLQLQGLDLDYLPKCVAGLSELRDLNLSGRYHNIKSGVVQINVKEHAHSIDLSPLKHTTKLRFIDLSYNSLKQIDLAPLSSLIDLEAIHLDYNLLETIYLEPLRNNIGLQQLVFSHNELQSIDLTPLEQCKKLTYLGLATNSLQALDLSPLKELKYLRMLIISNNQIKELDVTPLIGLFNMDLVSLDVGIRLQSLPLAIDYFSKFLIEYFWQINWILPEVDKLYKELFTRYQTLVKNFYYWEPWPDYKQRQTVESVEVDSFEKLPFFDHLASIYLRIKDKTPSNLPVNTKAQWRKQIEAELAEKGFLNADDLYLKLKTYWEVGNENRVYVELVDGYPLEGVPSSINVYHYWIQPQNYVNQRVESITCIGIVVHEDLQLYDLDSGFQGDELQYGENIYPPYQEYNPRNLLYSLTVGFGIRKYEKKSILEVLPEAHIILTSKYRGELRAGVVEPWSISHYDL